MTFLNKIKWILGILLVFVLIATTNLIDRNNFVRVRDSVVTIYEDRLIAKELIYEMSKSVNAKEIALIAKDSSFFNKKNQTLNTQIEGILSRFEKTKLTPEESKIFEELKSNFKSLFNSEKNGYASNSENNFTSTGLFSNIKGNLDDLSRIQISEGSKQVAISKKAIDTVELFTQIEIYLLVFLAIAIQIIIIYNPKEKQ